MNNQSNRTGILILRLWIEGSVSDGFRARMTQTLDSTGEEQGTATAATPDGVYAAIRKWVEAFVHSNGVSPQPS